MPKRRFARRSLLLLAGAIAGGVFAGAVVAGRFADVPPERLEASLRDAPLVKVADIAAQRGHAARAVFVQASRDFVCLWDAPSVSSPARQGGCNSAEDPLGGRNLTVSLAYDGGPTPQPVSDARLIGLASLEVASVQVLMNDGTRRDIPLRRTPALSGSLGPLRAFGYRFRPSDLRDGLGPTKVLAFDAAGRQIGEQPTGWLEGS
jgi:hypothetical protein